MPPKTQLIVPDSTGSSYTTTTWTVKKPSYLLSEDEFNRAVWTGKQLLLCDDALTDCTQRECDECAPCLEDEGVPVWGAVLIGVGAAVLAGTAAAFATYVATAPRAPQ